MHDPADDDVKCVICMNPIQPREFAYRLRCGHTLHAECWDWMNCPNVEPCESDQQVELSCPKCQGQGEIFSSHQWSDSRRLFQQMTARTQTSASSTQDPRVQSAMTQTIPDYVDVTMPRSVQMQSEHRTSSGHRRLEINLSSSG